MDFNPTGSGGPLKATLPKPKPGIHWLPIGAEKTVCGIHRSQFGRHVTTTTLREHATCPTCVPEVR